MACNKMKHNTIIDFWRRFWMRCRQSYCVEQDTAGHSIEVKTIHLCARN